MLEFSRRSMLSGTGEEHLHKQQSFRANWLLLANIVLRKDEKACGCSCLTSTGVEVYEVRVQRRGTARGALAGSCKATQRNTTQRGRATGRKGKRLARTGEGCVGESESSLSPSRHASHSQRCAASRPLGSETLRSSSIRAKRPHVFGGGAAADACAFTAIDAASGCGCGADVGGGGGRAGKQEATGRGSGRGAAPAGVGVGGEVGGEDGRGSKVDASSSTSVVARYATKQCQNGVGGDAEQAFKCGGWALIAGRSAAD